MTTKVHQKRKSVLSRQQRKQADIQNKAEKVFSALDHAPQPTRMRRGDVVAIRPAGKKPWNEDFRISSDLIAEAQVERITDAQARSIYGLSAPRDWDLGGIVFPYLDRETGKMVYCRVRRDLYEKGKGGKYHGNSTKNYERRLYTAPGAAKRLKLKRTFRLLVESEKATLAIEAWARRLGRKDIVPIGMGGCQGWRDKEHGVLPDLSVCDGAEVIILLDANVHTNPQVREALNALVAELGSRKCRVMVAELPQMEGINGPDDLLKIPEGDAFLTAILSSATDTTVAPYSEHGLAERFATANRDNACYVHGIGWHVWDGRRWKPDDQGEVELLCQELCRTAAGECSKLWDQNRIRSRRTREAILREAQARLAVGIDQLDKDTMLLNTPGGTVDLRTGKIRPAQREDYCTKLAGVAPSAIKPKRFLQFLNETTNDNKALANFHQRVAGCCLTGDVSEQEVYFFFGPGANGKSVHVNALMLALGEYAKTAPSEVFMVAHNPQHATSIAALRGARLVAVSEVEDGSRWAESKLKELTGGTPITARFMRQDEFTFMPQFKLIISGNHKPRLRNVDNSMMRRLRLVPFTVQIPKSKQDTKLIEKLTAELGGILQWAIEGCVAWQHKGMQTPRSVVNASDEYFEMQDTLGTWLSEQTVAHKAAKTASTELYFDYKSWCDSNGEFTLRQKEFSQKLSARGFDSKKLHGGIKHFIGLRLREIPIFASGGRGKRGEGGEDAPK